MTTSERLHKRPLRRPINAETLARLRSEYHKRRNDLGIASELVDHPGDPHRMTIKSRWASLDFRFHDQMMIVDARLSLAARLMATEHNRRRVVRFIDDLADELDL